MNLTLIGIAILFSAYVVNRFIMTEATKKLSDSDKLKLFEVFSKRNKYTTIFLLLLILIFFGAIEYLPHFTFQIAIVYFIIFILYLTFRFASNYKKLKQIEMPDAYIKRFIISFSIFTTGFLGLAFCSLLSWF